MPWASTASSLASRCSVRILAPEACRPFKLGDARVERAVLVMRRAEIAQARVWLAAEPLHDSLSDARFADAGLARDQHDAARRRALACSQRRMQQLDLLVAADQRRGGCAQRLEAALDRARAQHLPGWHVLGEALEGRWSRDRDSRTGRRSGAVCSTAMTTVPGSASACSRAARFGVSPTTACSWAAPAPIRSPTTTSPVAMPTRTCKGDAGGSIELRHGFDQGKPGADRALGIVLMRLRIAEIGEHAVAHVLGDEAADCARPARRSSGDRRR